MYVCINIVYTYIYIYRYIYIYVSFFSGTFLVAQPKHLHQRTLAARARKSANMVSANMVSMALTPASYYYYYYY